MKKSIKQQVLSLLKLNNTPREIAFGISIGIFIAVMPLYGLHTILVVLAALVFRRANKIAMLVGTNISLPPTLPFITWAGYSMGRLLLNCGYPEFNWAVFKGLSYRDLGRLYYPLFVGSLLLAFLCAATGYFCTLWFMNRKFRERKRKENVS